MQILILILSGFLLWGAENKPTNLWVLKSSDSFSYSRLVSLEKVDGIETCRISFEKDHHIVKSKGFHKSICSELSGDFLELVKNNTPSLACSHVFQIFHYDQTPEKKSYDLCTDGMSEKHKGELSQLIMTLRRLMGT
jgi:hypothetical protein